MKLRKRIARSLRRMLNRRGPTPSMPARQSLTGRRVQGVSGRRSNSADIVQEAIRSGQYQVAAQSERSVVLKFRHRCKFYIVALNVSELETDPLIVVAFHPDTGRQHANLERFARTFFGPAANQKSTASTVRLV